MKQPDKVRNRPKVTALDVERLFPWINAQLARHELRRLAVSGTGICAQKQIAKFRYGEAEMAYCWQKRTAEGRQNFLKEKAEKSLKK